MLCLANGTRAVTNSILLTLGLSIESDQTNHGLRLDSKLHASGNATHEYIAVVC
jgi:hypothetical protein